MTGSHQQASGTVSFMDFLPLNSHAVVSQLTVREHLPAMPVSRHQQTWSPLSAQLSQFWDQSKLPKRLGQYDGKIESAAVAAGAG